MAIDVDDLFNVTDGVARQANDALDVIGTGCRVARELTRILEHHDVAIASQATCDQNPLDPANADDRLRLRSYIWADQTARMERLNAALELGRTTGSKPEKADAAEWVRTRLGGPSSKWNCTRETKGECSMRW